MAHVSFIAAQDNVSEHAIIFVSQTNGALAPIYIGNPKKSDMVDGPTGGLITTEIFKLEDCGKDGARREITPRSLSPSPLDGYAKKMRVTDSPEDIVAAFKAAGCAVPSIRRRRAGKLLKSPLRTLTKA